MTDDVGAITGPVEVWLEGPAARIRYEGALETYTVTGAVLDRSLDEVLTVLTTDPGVDEFGNPRSTSLDPEALSRGD